MSALAVVTLAVSLTTRPGSPSGSASLRRGCGPEAPPGSGMPRARDMVPQGMSNHMKTTSEPGVMSERICFCPWGVL
eukprot:10281633-Heterocapsa_arctica.AAC.1